MGNIRKLIPQPLINYGKHLPEALIANIKYGFPGRKLRVIGVTGTDGKTTTTNMIYQILKSAGKKVSMISTINASIAGKSYDIGFHVTSPKESDVQRYLKASLDNGDEFMVLEITSHALDQFRAWGVNFEIGVITNITHEHLDYHKTLGKYLLTKSKLIKNVKYAVLNLDDQSFEKLRKLTTGKVVSFGHKITADFNPQKFPLNLIIPGDYNILNAEAAAAATFNLGIDQKVIQKSLNDFTGLEGRMEEIKNKLGIKIVVDFAHTPNALEQALKTLREQTKGRLISVFGAASERDLAKRPIMGKISAQLANITILTDEDPRFEGSLKIIEDISKGAMTFGAKLNHSLFKFPDRSEAIKMAIKMAKKGDTIGIFGKGHEKSMNYQGKELPWSDKKAVLEALHESKD